jgi:PKD repeat protein
VSNGTSFHTTLWATVFETLPPPTIVFYNPICGVGLGASLSGFADWQHAKPGQISVWWGDGTMKSSALFPMSHTYVAPGTYTVSATATDAWGAVSTSAQVTVGTGVQNCFYAVSPRPIAKAGSLRGRAQVTVVVKVTDVGGYPLEASVWLSFKPTAGGGSATVESILLGQSPAPFLSDSTGDVTVTYTAPAQLPSTGTDVLKIADESSRPSLSITDSYRFH